MKQFVLTAMLVFGFMTMGFMTMVASDIDKWYPPVIPVTPPRHPEKPYPKHPKDSLIPKLPVPRRVM